MTPKNGHDALRAVTTFYEDLVGTYEVAINNLKASLRAAEDARAGASKENDQLRAQVSKLEQQLRQASIVSPEP